MQDPLNDKRPVPDWIVDFYLEKPIRDKAKTSIGKHDSLQNNYSISKQRRAVKLELKSNEYIKPTYYYF